MDGTGANRVCSNGLRLYFEGCARCVEVRERRKQYRRRVQSCTLPVETKGEGTGQDRRTKQQQSVNSVL
jgi:hypothetical protein